eukprot:746328-Hanusia_phi.AAC.1
MTRITSSGESSFTALGYHATTVHGLLTVHSAGAALTLRARRRNLQAAARLLTDLARPVDSSCMALRQLTGNSVGDQEQLGACWPTHLHALMLSLRASASGTRPPARASQAGGDSGKRRRRGRRGAEGGERGRGIWRSPLAREALRFIRFAVSSGRIPCF